MLGLPGTHNKQEFTSYSREDLKPEVFSIRVKFTGEVEICIQTEHSWAEGFRAKWVNYESFLYKTRVISVPSAFNPKSISHISIEELLERTKDGTGFI